MKTKFMNKIAIAAPVVITIIIGLFFMTYDFDEKITDTIEMNQQQSIQAYAEIGHFLGTGNAPVTIIEFGDYQCPFCSQWYKETMPTIKNTLVETGKVDLIFVDYAFLGPDSLPAARASYCVEEQGKYWEFHDALYTNQEGVNSGWVNLPNIKRFASSIDLDMMQFDQCMESNSYLNKVEKSIQLSIDSGVQQTPTFFIMTPDGLVQKIEGKQPLEVFTKILSPYVEVDFDTPSNTEPLEDELILLGDFDISNASPIEGDIDAPITIIEFGDYQCTSCDRWFLNEKPIIEKEYFSDDKVNMIFIDFPFQGDDSYIAAEATWCAHDQGKYFEYHSNLYVNQGNLEDGWADNESLKMYAKYLNLNTEEFNECLDSEKYSDKVLYNKNVGSSNGVEGTPTFFIIGPDGFSQKIQGPQPAAVFMNIIDSIS